MSANGRSLSPSPPVALDCTFSVSLIDRLAVLPPFRVQGFRFFGGSRAHFRRVGFGFAGKFWEIAVFATAMGQKTEEIRVAPAIRAWAARALDPTAPPRAPGFVRSAERVGRRGGGAGSMNFLSRSLASASRNSSRSGHDEESATRMRDVVDLKRVPIFISLSRTVLNSDFRPAAARTAHIAM